MAKTNASKCNWRLLFKRSLDSPGPETQRDPCYDGVSSAASFSLALWQADVPVLKSNLV